MSAPRIPPAFEGTARPFLFNLPTQVDFGLGASERTVEYVTRLGRRPFVITDQGVVNAGLVEPILARLEAAGAAHCVFQHTEANPRAATVDLAAELAAGHEADVLLAIGGGSPIDTAKGASAVLGHGGRVLDYEGWDAVPGPCTPVVAVPTTAGTGSEVTAWSVITDPARSVKTAVGSWHIAPRVAIVDPVATVSMPPGLTAATGMDALTHAVEAYTARCSNLVSDTLALAAIGLIGDSLRRAVREPGDTEARSAMMLASLMAGMAFGNSDTAAVHSMAEALGGLLDVPHGLANAIFLPHVVAHNQVAVPEKTARIGLALGLHDGRLPTDDACAVTVRGLFGLARDLGIPDLRSTGATLEHVGRLSELAQANLGTPDNPVEMTEESFRLLFEAALEA